MLIYIIWLSSTAAALVCAWWLFILLKKRDAYQNSLLAIQEAPLMTDDFAGQAKLLCEACVHEIGADGCTLYLQPANSDETGFRRAAAAGIPADETGPGTVKDLISQCWDSGAVSESSAGGRYMAAFPVLHGCSGGGVMIAAWNGGRRPGEAERALLKFAASAASLLAPRFSEGAALEEVSQELQSVRNEMAQESMMADVGRLSSSVAHELSQPLGAVLTMVSSLSRSISDPVSSRRLHIIQDAVQKCKETIEKLLVYTRSSVRQDANVSFSRFIRAATDLNKVIGDSLEMVREDYERKIKLQVQYADNLPAVVANSGQWVQAFTNVLVFLRDCFKVENNASPLVKVSTGFAGGMISIVFASNSRLIPQDRLADIFEPSFSQERPELSSCLGLGVVREIVRKYNGTVEAVKADDGGMSIIVKVPLEA